MKKKMQFASRKYNRNLSGTHYTTLGFGEILPSWSCEQVIGDKVKISPNLFMRSVPQVLPNMANLSISNRAFFCTFSSVWKNYENFLQGNPVSWASDQPKEPIKEVPYITQNDFFRILTNNFQANSVFCKAVDVSTEAIYAQTPYDFKLNLPNAGATQRMTYYYELTRKGKQVVKIFHALDYNFDWQLKYVSNDVLGELDDSEHLSALPLLCFFKVVQDYLVPSNLRPSNYIDNLLFYINNVNTPTFHVSWDVLYLAFQNVVLYHDSNYFTSQWLTPTEPAPNLSMFGTLIANDIDLESDASERISYTVPSAVVNNDDGLVQSANRGNNASATNYTLTHENINYDQIKVINQLRSFIMRNNLVGSLPIQRLFARFGIKVPELQLQMSQYFGNYDINITTQAVVSTNGNDGSDSSLGDLGGMSYANQKENHTFEFTCTQNGMSFILTSIDVPSMYISGVGRHLYHLTPFSYYTPEFDDSIMQATRGNELMGRLPSMRPSEINSLRNELNLNSDDIFGYIKRYAEYRFGRSRVTGDYVLKNYRNPIQGYILPRNPYDEDRLLDYIEDKADNEVDYEALLQFFYYNTFNPITIQSEDDAIQFGRIYKDIDQLSDPFQIEFTFDVNVFGAVKSNELDEFLSGDGDTFEFEKNGGHLN